VPAFYLLGRFSAVKIGDFREEFRVEGDLREQVVKVTRDLITGLSLDLVDVSVTRAGGSIILRIAVDKNGGVTLDECARASELIGQVLERENVVKGSYVLEVMSPGVNRQLRKPEDFKKSIGKRVKVKLGQPFEGTSKLSGILRDAGEESFSIDTGHEVLDLKYQKSTHVRLDPQLPW
jgi:ribosome maturation factor RimP